MDLLLTALNRLPEFVTVEKTLRAGRHAALSGAAQILSLIHI